jgi:hypothetical protein
MLDGVTERKDEDDRGDGAGDEAEVVDGVPVPEGPRAYEAPPPVVTSRSGIAVANPVAVQAAAVAVTGFAAGAATVAAVRRHRARKALRGSRKALGEVRATRSFLVDIHLLNR